MSPSQLQAALPQLPGSVRRRFMTGICAVMVMYGFSVTMIGPLMPSLLGAYSLRLAGGGLIETLRSVGGIVAALLVGGLSDRYPKAVLVAALFAAYALTLLFIGTAPGYPLLLAIFFLLGAATRLVDSISNALTADLFPASSERALNLLHTLFGVGALAGPLFARAVLLKSGEWQHAYAVLALLCFGVLALFLWLQLNVLSTARRHRFHEATGAASAEAAGAGSAGAAAAAAGARRESPLRLMRHGRMWLLSGVMFLYVAHQAGTSVWLPTYAESVLGASLSLASATTAALWAGIVAGRIIMIRLSGSAATRSVLFWGLSVGGLSLGAGFLGAHPWWLAAASLLTGLCTGAVIPLVVSVACRWEPNHSGSASALVFFNASFSRMIIPWLIGVLAERVAFSAAMGLTWLPLIAAAGLALFLPPPQTARPRT